MVGPRDELNTAEWMRVIAEARALGVLQLGLSGGEPLVRGDIEELARHARSLGLYTTLVTSGIGLTPARARKLRDVGLEHIQISIQDSVEESADLIAGMKGVRQKMAAAEIVRELGFAFSVNVVLHRANIDRVGAIIELAANLGADRLELANTQYYGWALENRRMLMPTAAQVAAAADVAEKAVPVHAGRMQILYVLPDYYESFPKPCYAGWGNHYLVVMPDGRTLPCHGAVQITTLHFDSVRDRSLRWIRVHDLPDFVYFNHSIHVKKGMGCETCHGRVDQMPLMRQVQSLQMEWCLDCHRNPEKYVRPRSEVFTMDYRPAVPQTVQGPLLVKEYGIKGNTSCSTCHR